jgi:antitoxin VapB
MALYIRDDVVNGLADRLARLTGASKTEAVRMALESQIAALKHPVGLRARLGRVRALALAAGLRPDGADDKVLMDELSGGI